MFLKGSSLIDLEVTERCNMSIKYIFLFAMKKNIGWNNDSILIFSSS